ncbi:hypothetical protein Tco_0312768 [Tanacetum coccineum]
MCTGGPGIGCWGGAMCSRGFLVSYVWGYLGDVIAAYGAEVVVRDVRNWQEKFGCEKGGRDQWGGFERLYYPKKDSGLKRGLKVAVGRRTEEDRVGCYRAWKGRAADGKAGYRAGIIGFKGGVTGGEREMRVRREGTPGVGKRDKGYGRGLRVKSARREIRNRQVKTRRSGCSEQGTGRALR